MLYLGFEYLDGYYGVDNSTLLVPQDVQYYRTTTDNVYVIHWEFTEESYVPGLEKFTYELQLDTVDTFDSPNLEIFGLNVVDTILVTSTTATTFSSNTIGSSSLTLASNQVAGKVVQITSGTGSGQLRRILSNTSDTLTTEFSWSTVPDGTSVFFVYQSNVQNFQNGNEAKGYEIIVPSRALNSGVQLFTRVRTLGSTIAVTNFSETKVVQLLDRFDLVEAENLINNLPDYHIYNKNVLKLPEADRNTLLWKIMVMYGKEIDRALLLKELVKTDNYLTFTRDENLFANFGSFFNFIKPTSMQFVDYRRCLQAMVEASLEGSTDAAINRIVRCFTGVHPTIKTVRDVADFFLTTILEQFSTTGTTNTYQFTENDSFVPGTLMVVRDSATSHALLTPIQDYTEKVSLPGFTTSITDPSGVTLSAFYDISEPSPAVFDPLDIYDESDGFPPTIWDSRTEAYGVVIEVQNPALFTLDQALITKLVNLVLPAHIKSFITFP